jgi:hypothetical protein
LEPLFDRTVIQYGEAKSASEIIKPLLEVPRLKEANSLTKAKAIALILTLDPQNAEARSCDDELAKNASLRTSLQPAVEIVHQLLEAKQQLLRGPQQLKLPQNRLLAEFLADIAGGITVSDPNLTLRVEQERIAAKELDWSTAFPSLTARAKPATTAAAPEGRVLAQANAPKFRTKQASVFGLLVRDLGSNKFAGAASRMTATVAPDTTWPDYEALIKFNQPVGSSMATALTAVTTFMKVRHNGLPAGQIVDIGFQDKYSSKDGPSAAVACALLLESLYTGRPLNPEFAVTGDLNADGRVQPIGGVTGKIRAAAMGSCSVLAVPAGNASTLTDLVLLAGPQSVSPVQIILVESFDDALRLAAPATERDPAFQQAFTLFATVQELISRDPGKILTTLHHPKVQERLAEIVKLETHHASARLLLAAGQNRIPQTLTLRGSFASMDEAAAPAYQAIETKSFRQRSFFDRNEFYETKIELTRLRPKVDPRARSLCDALVEFYDLLAELFESTGEKAATAIGTKLDVAAQHVTGARESLLRNPEIMEEIQSTQ